ncbi:MAG TPA: hypothetical protein VJ810_41510 [Blastocatellia bacterium]|nr:hypothetical protein [Blastocatellia bacterium]
MRFTTPRILIASTIINFGISWTILFGLVMGSGVLPVSLPLLALIALILSIIAASFSIIAEKTNRGLNLLVGEGTST